MWDEVSPRGPSSISTLEVTLRNELKLIAVSIWTDRFFVAYRYIGKLLNGKQFDANTAGAPFNFRLGAGEVIKGWDQGVAGMAVGGERKLTVSVNTFFDQISGLAQD